MTGSMINMDGPRSLPLPLIIVATFAVLFLSCSSHIPQFPDTIPSASAQSLETVTVTVMDTGDQFEIEASLSNGLITNATLYPEFNYIIFDLMTSETDGGELTVTLPRSLIDAKSEDLQLDGTFTVVLDNYEADYTEENSSENQRTIIVPIGAGVVEATIVGTQVLPEFPAIILALVAGVIACIIGFGRFSMHSRSVPSR